MILLYHLIWEYTMPFLGGRIQLSHDSVFSFLLLFITGFSFSRKFFSHAEQCSIFICTSSLKVSLFFSVFFEEQRSKPLLEG